MFQAGEWIVCDHNGVCRILDITQMPELKKGVLYYELEPAGSAGSRIYAPVDGGRLVMRRLITAAEAKRLLEEIPLIEEIAIASEKKREEQYREAAKQYDCRQWVRLIKTIHTRKRLRRLEGKKATYIDDKYISLAESNLYGELSAALDLTFGEAERLVREKIRAQELTEAENNV